MNSVMFLRACAATKVIVGTFQLVATPLGAILGLFGSDRAGTALARQQSMARSWQATPYQLNVFALTYTELNRTELGVNTFDSR